LRLGAHNDLEIRERDIRDRTTVGAVIDHNDFERVAGIRLLLERAKAEAETVSIVQYWNNYRNEWRRHVGAP
jgi:hypothetical protein